MNFDSMIVTAALEGVYGTDATPGSANSMLASSIQMNALEGGNATRENPRPSHGGYRRLPVGTHQLLSFDIEIAGSGAAGSAPAWATLDRMCGFDETLNASTDARYGLVSTGQESGTLYFQIDGQQYILLGARGNKQWRFNASGIPYFRYEFKGLFTTPTSATPIVPNFSAFQAPVEVSATNTPTSTLHGQVFNVKELTINRNSNVPYRNMTGREEIVINGRDITGTMLCLALPFSGFNPVDRARQATEGAFQWVHGITAGNIFELTAPAVQITGVEDVGDEKEYMWRLQLAFLPSTTDDELLQIVR